MKPIRFILLIMSIAVASTVFAQSPQRFNYQAVARDASGNPMSEKPLGVRISILENSEAGTELYSETFNQQTSKQGLFSIQVGSGSVVSGAFSSIVWGATPKFLKVEIDPAGGTSFVLLGTSQLLSVPYAFAADKLSSPLPISELSDVSDVVPMVDQVLTWDGTSWTPGSGAGSLVTSTEFLGSGSSLDPLKLAPQGAANGQVLQFNGTDWQPATISGGVGDNWGTQSVSTNTTLSGVGTSASPLALAQQGATLGQFLKWNGTKWLPGFEVGDNWGTAKVNTSSQFEGDGTPVSPLKLSSNGAAVGQSLMWNGTTWVADFLSGGLNFPYTGAALNAGTGFQITNSTGSSIEGLATGNGADIVGVKGTISNTGAGTGTSGVLGRNLATNSNGFGVSGIHSGGGVGVYGEAIATGTGLSGKAGSGGVGVFGGAAGVAGVGVVGVSATGVIGTTNTATGKGIYGNATAGGYAGYFDGKTLLKYNSTAADPNLYIWEDDTADKARVRFNNSIAGKFWDIGAKNTTSASPDLDKFTVTHFSNGDILTVSGDKRVGINLGNPSVELDVNGSIKLNGSLTANGSLGTNGQVLQSTGLIATWGSATNALFNNTYFYDQTAAVNNVSTVANSLTGLNNMTFTTTGAARVIVTFSHGQLVSTGTGDVDLQVEVGFMNSTATVVINKAVINDVIVNNKKGSISFTHHCFFGGAGTYLPYVYVGTTNGGKFNALNTNGAGQVTVQVIPQ